MSTSGKIGAILAIAISLVIAGVLVRDGRVLAAGIPFLLYAGIALISTSESKKPQITVDRHLSVDHITEGETLDVTVIIANTGPAIPWLGVAEHIPRDLEVTSGETTHFVSLAEGAMATFSYTLRAPRGLHTLPGADITTWQRITLMSQQQFAPHETKFLAVPIAEPIDDIEIRPRRTRAYAGVVQANRGGSGIDFFGCHAYTTGDDIRRINWRAYARTRELIVNEYEQERIADVTVFLDARERANSRVGTEKTFTYAVRAAASMAKYFIKQGNSVGLFIYGEYMDWTFPGYGKDQMARILDSLARAETSDKEVFDDLRAVPTRLFPPRSQLVMISGALDEHDVEVLGVLRAHGYQIIMIMPDMLRYEVDQIPKSEARDLALRIVTLRRKLILDALARIGVEVVQWDVADSLASLLSWTLSRRGRRIT
ncbi:MAG: DUF58 domain-containing protein [Candidatus Bipolaricaulota bacterium]|nr:DUF58 domain-containing protein [Candidatus Bipolaricaulota bacterium]